MAAQRGLILVACCTATLCGNTMGQLDQGCNTELELYEMFEHVKTVCHSADEKFADPYDPVPSSCVTLDCADAVRRAERECGPLLDKSGWFKTRKSQLAAAVHRCETAAVDPDRYVVQPAFSSGPMRGTVHTISSCRGTISDGEGQCERARQASQPAIACYALCVFANVVVCARQHARWQQLVALLQDRRGPRHAREV
jgi:hypothetical protein